MSENYRPQRKTDVRKQKSHRTEHCFAAAENILECTFEISSVPRVCNIAACTCIGHQKMYSAIRIIRNDMPYESHVGGVHAYYPVEMPVIVSCNTPSGLTGIEYDTVLIQRSARRRIDMIADLFI